MKEMDEKQGMGQYQTTKMQKELIIARLKERGCRITKQRQMLLTIILEQDCSCCKEIYYQALKKDPHIGTATVYRLINMLEEIGAISRKNMYKIACQESCDNAKACRVEFDDHTVCRLSAQKWNQVIEAGLKECGYMTHQSLKHVVLEGITE